ncbi:MAG: indole-3-glycerol phosphate synthase TrpC [Lachnospiraceae bacterium]|nr:indole-3-glycerol phosphate synthase TrpC [Lachnospiraceae bacterium]
MTILDTLASHARARTLKNKHKISEEEIRKAALALGADTGFPFEKALAQPGMSFICEVKKASPSKGIIARDFPYLEIAREYEQAGASAISCLTEPDFFMGSDEYLREIAAAVKIPVLRKDFTVDPYMIYEAKVLGASAVLLICAILTDEELIEYGALARSLGLSALVEAHDEREVERALRVDKAVIGVNNRDLRNFTVDCRNSVRLRKMVPGDRLFVSESGIQTPTDIEILRENGVDAVLIGETLMRSPDKAAELRCLKGE